jgi:hypothetical protein
VSDERIDPETLAAFLDGTASPEEREGVLRTLSRSKEAYASFLEASAIQRELAAETPAVAPAAPVAASVEPPRSPAREAANARWFRRPRYVTPALLAAGVAAIMVVRGIGGPVGQGAIQLAQATSLTQERGSGALARGLGDAWDQPPWAVVRGSESSLATRSVAVRSGARYAELEAAAQAADSAAVSRSAESLAQLLSSVEGAAPIAASVRDMARPPDFGGRAQRATVAGQLRALLGAEDWFDLGVWTETARLAVAARALAFFEPGGRGVAELQRILQPHIAESRSDSAEWGPVIEALRPLIAGRVWSPNELPAIEARVRVAMEAAAR